MIRLFSSVMLLAFAIVSQSQEINDYSRRSNTDIEGQEQILALAGQKVPFQGKLLENGSPVSGTRDIEFSISDISWTELHTAVSISNGFYSVVLGSIVPMPPDIFGADNTAVINIKVGETALTAVTIYPAVTKPGNLLSDDFTGTTDSTFFVAKISGAPSDADTQKWRDAIIGDANTTGDNTGVRGRVSAGGIGKWNVGVWGEADGTVDDVRYGVRGNTYGTGSGYSIGVLGYNQTTPLDGGLTYGGRFRTFNGSAGSFNRGVAGEAQGELGINVGVYGRATGSSEENWAGWFDGDVKINGKLLFDGGNLGINGFDTLSYTLQPNDTAAISPLYTYHLLGSNDDSTSIRAALRGSSETSGWNIGLEGQSKSVSGNSSFQYGVRGVAEGDGTGWHYGMRGEAWATQGINVAVRGMSIGESSGTNYGGFFSGRNSTGFNIGVNADANGPSKFNTGVQGRAQGAGDGSTGYEDGSYNNGVYGIGKNNPWGNSGVFGVAEGETGVDNNGVIGWSHVNDGSDTIRNHAVHGRAFGPGENFGVKGSGEGGRIAIGVYGQAYDGTEENWAGWFEGDLHVTGNLTVDGSSPGGGGSIPGVDIGNDDRNGTPYGWINLDGSNDGLNHPTRVRMSIDSVNGPGSMGRLELLSSLEDPNNSGEPMPMAWLYAANNGSGMDPARASGQMLLWGPESPNILTGGDDYIGNDLGRLHIFGDNDDGGGWFQSNMDFYTRNDSTSSFAEVLLRNTDDGGVSNDGIILNSNLWGSGAGGVEVRNPSGTAVLLQGSSGSMHLYGPSDSTWIDGGYASFQGDVHINGNLSVDGSAPGGLPGSLNAHEEDRNGVQFGRLDFYGHDDGLGGNVHRLSMGVDSVGNAGSVGYINIHAGIDDGGGFPKQMIGLYVANDMGGSDPTGLAGSMNLEGTSTPNVQIGSQSWENHDLGRIGLFGYNDDGGGYTQSNADLFVGEQDSYNHGNLNLISTGNGGDQYGSVSITSNLYGNYGGGISMTDSLGNNTIELNGQDGTAQIGPTWINTNGDLGGVQQLLTNIVRANEVSSGQEWDSAVHVGQNYVQLITGGDGSDNGLEVANLWVGDDGGTNSWGNFSLRRFGSDTVETISMDGFTGDVHITGNLTVDGAQPTFDGSDFSSTDYNGVPHGRFTLTGGFNGLNHSARIFMDVDSSNIGSHGQFTLFAGIDGGGGNPLELISMKAANNSGNADDPNGASGRLTLDATNSSNFEIAGKDWSSNDYPVFRMMGTRGDTQEEPMVEFNVDSTTTYDHAELLLSSGQTGVPSTTRARLTSNWNSTESGGLELWNTSGSAIRLEGDNGIVWADSIDVTSIYTVNAVNVTSDKKFKTEITRISNPLDKIMSIRGVTYYWNDLAREVKGVKNETRQVGVIAQDIERVLPELVSTDSKGYKAVDYSSLNALLIEAIKELNQKVEKLSAENKELKAELAKTSQDELEKMKAEIASIKALLTGGTEKVGE